MMESIFSFVLYFKSDISLEQSVEIRTDRKTLGWVWSKIVVVTIVTW